MVLAYQVHHIQPIRVSEICARLVYRGEIGLTVLRLLYYVGFAMVYQ